MVSMGLREEQKELRRAAILQAAREQVNEVGYKKLRMEKIAEEAKVGIATIYTYFGGKENLVREVFYPEIVSIFEKGEEVLSRPCEDPCQAVIDLLRCYMRLGNGWTEKNLLRLFTIPSPVEPYPSFAGMIEYSDSTATDQIRRLLNGFQESGKVPPHIQVDKVAEIIFYIMNQQYIRCVISETEAPEKCFRDIESLVTALFECWGGE